MDARQRLAKTSVNARQAEEQGDDGLAAAEWRRYRLIKDSTRDPEELLAEGIALSTQALQLAAANS
jgi:hypothetical protein